MPNFFMNKKLKNIVSSVQKAPTNEKPTKSLTIFLNTVVVLK